MRRVWKTLFSVNQAQGPLHGAGPGRRDGVVRAGDVACPRTSACPPERPPKPRRAKPWRHWLRGSPRRQGGRIYRPPFTARDGFAERWSRRSAPAACPRAKRRGGWASGSPRPCGYCKRRREKRPCEPPPSERSRSARSHGGRAHHGSRQHRLVFRQVCCGRVRGRPDQWTLTEPPKRRRTSGPIPEHLDQDCARVAWVPSREWVDGVQVDEACSCVKPPCADVWFVFRRVSERLHLK